MATALTSTSLKVKLPDLEQVPEPRIEFGDMDTKTRETALLLGKIAYLAKERGDVVNWTDCAQLIKEEFDKQIGATWHCIVGTSFGTFITHQAKTCMFFSVGHMKVLLFKHG